jgi:hypothetical protein
MAGFAVLDSATLPGDVNVQFPVTGMVAIPRRQFAKNSHGEKSPDKCPRSLLTPALFI